jgi:hypothetical protein
VRRALFEHDDTDAWRAEPFEFDTRASSVVERRGTE